MDDRIGRAVVQFSQDALLDAGPTGIGFRRRFRSEGDWEITGRASGRRLQPALAGSGDDEVARVRA